MIIMIIIKNNFIYLFCDRADVSSVDEVKHLIDTTVRTYGRLDGRFINKLTKCVSNIK